jgi:hypothetical protein
MKQKKKKKKNNSYSKTIIFLMFLRVSHFYLEIRRLYSMDK